MDDNIMYFTKSHIISCIGGKCISFDYCDCYCFIEKVIDFLISTNVFHSFVWLHYKLHPPYVHQSILRENQFAKDLLTFVAGRRMAANNELNCQLDQPTDDYMIFELNLRMSSNGRLLGICAS